MRRKHKQFEAVEDKVDGSATDENDDLDGVEDEVGLDTVHQPVYDSEMSGGTVGLDEGKKKICQAHCGPVQHPPCDPHRRG